MTALSQLEAEKSDSRLADCGATVRTIDECMRLLARDVALLQIPDIDGREWVRLLRQKLLPQLRDDTYLVVAVVGGTNIGKSVIFNHIAGFAASATSPLASGTRHAVCLVPEGFASRHDLASIFPGFELSPWESSRDSLHDSPQDRIFWKESAETPPNLLVLDTPDIDSDAQVNWRRADGIRRVADVLIAVLTQQKYNDAAVKQFFRQAAVEGKDVIIVFNQCQLPEDEPYWPLWLKTFCSETGISPRYVYIAPNDRQSAEARRLPFFDRTTAAQGDGSVDVDSTPRSLSGDLSQLRFAEIKLSTLTGSLRSLADAEHGVPAFLREVELRCVEFENAAKWLASESMVKVHRWPAVPSRLVVDAVRLWWRSRQHEWAKIVHGVYDSVGNAVLAPFRFARERMQGEQPAPLEQYRAEEWNRMLEAVGEIYDRLTWMAESSDRLLRPHFERVLAGRSRTALLESLRARHQEVNLAIELSAAVNGEMRRFEVGSPELYRFYRQLNNLSAAARPLTSVVLFTIGFGPAGHAIAPVFAPLMDFGAHALGPIIADIASGTAAAVAGDTAIASGAGMLEAKFRNLQTAFMKRRVDWLLGQLHDKLLGGIPQELQTAARLPQSESFLALKGAARRLDEQVLRLTSPRDR